MYYRYYGFNKKPFEVLPDPDMVYMRDSHQEAMAILLYGQKYNKSFVLLTGEIGTGKTTLLQILLRTVYNKDHVCLINHPTFSVDDFYYFLAFKYGLEEYCKVRAKFLIEFDKFLSNCKKLGERVLLIIDEAHLLSIDLLEEIRLLSNHDTTYNVMSIFLVGQTEINELLLNKRLHALRQRIGIRFHLEKFSEKETKRYVDFRLLKAGTTLHDLFDDQAIKEIHKVSQGIPRLINIVCDNALVFGFAEGKRNIDVALIQECVKELKITGN